MKTPGTGIDGSRPRRCTARVHARAHELDSSSSRGRGVPCATREKGNVARPEEPSVDDAKDDGAEDDVVVKARDDRREEHERAEDRGRKWGASMICMHPDATAGTIRGTRMIHDGTKI